MPGRDSKVSGALAVLPLVALAAALTVPSLFTRDLWNPDEPRYAEVARGMRVLSDFVVPHLNESPSTPRSPRCSSGSRPRSRGRVSASASGRVVVALFFLGTLLLTRELGRLLFDERTGHLAGRCSSAPAPVPLGRKAGVLDVPLNALHDPRRLRPRGGTGGAPRAIVLFYAGMGLGTLTKGPVAILIPCLAAVAFRLVEGRGAPAARKTWIWGSR